MLYLVVRCVFVAASHYKHFYDVDVTVVCGHHQRSSRLCCVCVCVFVTMRGSANLSCSLENPSVICLKKRKTPYSDKYKKHLRKHMQTHTFMCYNISTRTPGPWRPLEHHPVPTFVLFDACCWNQCMNTNTHTHMRKYRHQSRFVLFFLLT